MAGITLKAINQKEFENKINKKSSQINKNLIRTVNLIANAIRNDAVTSINQNARKGKTVTRYNPTRTIKISEVGDAPAGDTGFLANQIYLKIDGNGLGGSVISNADYSQFLEFGTIKMGARPFMQPAAEKNRKKYSEQLKKGIKEGLK